ncbi:MAG: hypothetical protein KatS3mg032_0935 [Cyclobacteriaceae bacterium]|nr:MAG: hypothetical protein KatS3mg032_0935 [Cyclobacteriaceae bacterium]
MHAQEWWVLYELKSIPSWRPPLFLFVMLYPVSLYLLARMLYPNKFSKDKIDLKQFYFKSFPKIFFLAAISALLSVLYNRYILEMKWSS